MSGPFRARAYGGIAALIVGLTFSACDDGPTGPSEDFDLVGQWSLRVTNATAPNVSCSVTDVTLTFSRNNGMLTGHRLATGGGNVTCTIDGTPTTESLTWNDAIDNVTLVDTEINFNFSSEAGPWLLSGDITTDNRMGGTANISLASSAGILVVTGPWTATRN